MDRPLCKLLAALVITTQSLCASLAEEIVSNQPQTKVTDEPTPEDNPFASESVEADQSDSDKAGRVSLFSSKAPPSESTDVTASGSETLDSDAGPNVATAADSASKDRTVAASGTVDDKDAKDDADSSFAELKSPDEVLSPPQPFPISQPPMEFESIEELDDEEEIEPGRRYNAPGWYSYPGSSSLEWRAGRSNRFGEFAWDAITFQVGDPSDGLSLSPRVGLHFLDGPTQTDMPPRLFDVDAHLNWFGEVTNGVWADLGITAGVYSDFEDSTSDGWRFPAHAVFSWGFTPQIEPVAGLKFFDRQNLELLPVAGVIFRPGDEIRLGARLSRTAGQLSNRGGR